MLASGNKPWTRAIKRTISWCAPLSCYIATLFCNHGQHVHTSLARTPRSSQLVSCESHQLVSSRKGMWRPSRDTLSRLDDHSGTKSTTQHIPNSALTKDRYKIINFITHNEANQFRHMNQIAAPGTPVEREALCRWGTPECRGLGRTWASHSCLHLKCTVVFLAPASHSPQLWPWLRCSPTARQALLDYRTLNHQAQMPQQNHVDSLTLVSRPTETLIRNQGLTTQSQTTCLETRLYVKCTHGRHP